MDTEGSHGLFELGPLARPDHGDDVLTFRQDPGDRELRGSTALLLRQDGEGYFHLAGRAKELIISGGETVYPKEVEDLIAGFPDVAEVAVIGVPDPVYEERVVALVRPTPGAPPPPTDDVIAFVRARLAGFKTPKEVYIVDDFPRNAVGKISKPDLREQYGSVFGDDRG